MISSFWKGLWIWQSFVWSHQAWVVWYRHKSLAQHAEDLLFTIHRRRCCGGGRMGWGAMGTVPSTSPLWLGFVVKYRSAVSTLKTWLLCWCSVTFSWLFILIHILLSVKPVRGFIYSLEAVERSVIVPFGPEGLVARELAAVEIKESQWNRDRWGKRCPRGWKRTQIWLILCSSVEINSVFCLFLKLLTWLASVRCWFIKMYKPQLLPLTISLCVCKCKARKLLLWSVIWH